MDIIGTNLPKTLTLDSFNNKKNKTNHFRLLIPKRPETDQRDLDSPRVQANSSAYVRKEHGKTLGKMIL